MYTIKTIPEDFVVEEIYTPPQREGPFVYALLEKKDTETLFAIEQLARKLGIKTNSIGYAGIKDRRAVTKQYISIIGMSAAAIEKLGLRIVGRDNKGLSLGDHQGNKFSITVRNLGAKDIRRVEPRFATVKKGSYSFCNYFGEQRFGTHNVAIGVAILQRNFKKACDLIRDKKIKDYLDTHPKDHLGALTRLQKKRIMLYVHAVQSKLWNMIAERVHDENIPIPGYMTEFKNEEVRRLSESFLNDLGLTLRSFAIREIPNLFTGGGERERMVHAQNMRWKEFINDELNRGKKKITISFTLPKGAYATVCIDSLFG